MAAICAACRFENPPGLRFCGNCGAPLKGACPACGFENPPAFKFCGDCGASLAGPAASGTGPEPRSYTPRHLVERILTSRSALEGERKYVTVLFADCAGFTSIAERSDPEDVHAIMDRCFELILDQVHHYEGTVNQFTGDGAMALFGAPVALEDAPRRAVMAALGIQRALAALREELLASRGIDFRMRIGVHTGLVVVGKIGNDLRMDYTAIGDTTNLAARLQTLAAPGSVLISETTHRLVAGFFETRDLGLLAVKGKREAVRAFEVVGERAAGGRIDVLADTGLTPLAGRTRELGALREAFESARGGHGQVVFLVGEAGIGKSRLLYEFRRALAREPHVWIEGRCASYGTTTAFLPIADALLRYFGIDDRDDNARAFAKIERGVAALGGELGWTLPFVRLLLSLPAGDDAAAALDAATRRSQTFAALKALTLQAAREQPLVVLIEDLHWIDPASEEFLAYLADVVPATRALLVCSHRPGYRHSFGDRSYHVRIALRALSAGEMTAMADALLGASEVPAAARELILRKAEGNPLFVEEVTKSLLEEGALRREDGRVVLTRDLAEISVPDSIHGVLMARIDRLQDEPKRAIQIASVIGREFALRLLARISEAGDKAPALVAELRALELIYEKAVHPELAYMFKHALTHDVAYESILIQRRKELHRVIGATIEELYADRLAEHYETLAFHFGRAEEWERTLAYLERAAEKAAASHANAAVAEHCRAALTIADRLGARVPDERRRRLEEQLALACLYLSDFRESGDAFVRAAERSDDAETRSIDLGYASHSYVWGHAYESARRAADAALEIARAHGLASAEGMALCQQAFSRSVLEGDIARYDRELAVARRAAEAGGHEAIVTLIGFWQTQAAEWRGDYRRALALGEEVVAAGRRLKLPYLVILPAWFIGKAACCLGDYGRAIAELGEAYDITGRVGDRAWKTRILNTLGWCFAEFGDHERARAYNEQAAAVAHELGDAEITGNAEINLGGNHLALGDLERARGYLEPIYDGLDRREPFVLWRYSMHLYDGMGRLALALADDERVRARRHHSPKIEARALELRGRALLMLERREEAEAALGEAVRIAEGVGYPRAAWQALALLAELARRAGKRAEAEAHAARAQRLVETLAGSLPEPDLQRALHAYADGAARGA